LEDDPSNFAPAIIPAIPPAAAKGHASPNHPAPDTFLKAAEQLGVDPTRAAVVEDALSGVQAGCAGGFGLVIGINRQGDAEALKQHGADVVVDDLGDWPR
jgi:beta-phosphoglucomutase-like phosphatase (HAD superfamily)